jgi:hypothetical protein
MTALRGVLATRLRQPMTLNVQQVRFTRPLIGLTVLETRFMRSLIGLTVLKARFIPSMDGIHCPPGEIKATADHFKAITDRF